MIAIIEKNKKQEKCDLCGAIIPTNEQSLNALYKVGSDVVSRLFFCKNCACGALEIKNICKKLAIPEMRLLQLLEKFSPDTENNQQMKGKNNE
jgi:hypothetical protein